MLTDAAHQDLSSFILQLIFIFLRRLHRLASSFSACSLQYLIPPSLGAVPIFIEIFHAAFSLRVLSFLPQSSPFPVSISHPSREPRLSLRLISRERRRQCQCHAAGEGDEELLPCQLPRSFSGETGRANPLQWLRQSRALFTPRTLTLRQPSAFPSSSPPPGLSLHPSHPIPLSNQPLPSHPFLCHPSYPGPIASPRGDQYPRLLASQCRVSRESVSHPSWVKTK